MYQQTSQSTDRTSAPFGHLAWQILIPIAIALTLALFVLTFCCYLQIKENLTTQELQNLENYVELNRDRENTPFNEIQEHQQLLRDDILHDLQTSVPDSKIEERFNNSFTIASDGAWRNRPGSFNTQEHASLFIPVGSKPDIFLKRRLLAAVNKCETYGSTSGFYSINSYFMTPQKAWVIFWPIQPDYFSILPANYDLTKESYYTMATPEKDPNRETVWSDVYLDPYSNLWKCSAVTPVYDQNQYIGSIGTDILVKELSSHIEYDKLPGTYTFVVRKDGNLISHETYNNQILQSKDRFTVADTHDPELMDFFQIAKRAIENETIVDSSDHAYHLGIAPLRGPDWMMITVYPHATIERAAFRSARMIMILGLVILFLVLAFLYYITWNKVEKPLDIMTRATGHVAEGDLNVRLDSSHRNELGEVAHSFNIMVAKLAERQASLQASMVERESAERKILEAQRLESLAILAGGVAHDFSNLLTGILGNIAVVQSDTAHNPLLRDVIETIDHCARRAAELCKQMLAYSGKGLFQITGLQINELIEDTSELLRVSVNMDAKLVFKLGTDLPPILADATQVRQVLMNLVLNSSEAIGKQEGTITITTEKFHLRQENLQECIYWPEVKSGDYVMLEVQDTGRGMTPEILSKIFDPFFSTKFTGRGLGLAAVLGIVRSHKGAIQVRSKPDCGSTMRILFPASTRPAREKVAGKHTSALHKMTGLALIVDDEVAVREVAIRMMQIIGFKTISAVDGRDALEKFELHSDELKFVLMDLTMPHVDGLTAFAEMNRTRPDIPVLIMSGYNEKDVGSRSESGLAGFVQKPFDLQTLHVKVQAILTS